MDQIKIGKFIAERRKALQWTQVQLAEKVGVTNKSVSKWERGVCLPDVSLYTQLCELLGITLNEFFAGEFLSEEHITEKAEETILNVAQDKKRQVRKLRIVISILTATILLLITATFYYLKAQGFFLNNYIRGYSFPDGMYELIDLADKNAHTSFFELRTKEQFHQITVFKTVFQNGHPCGKPEELLSIGDFSGLSGYSGYIVMSTDLDTHSFRVSIDAVGGTISSEDIKLNEAFPDADVSYQGNAFFDSRDFFRSLQAGKEIGFYCFHLSNGGIAALGPEEIEENPAEALNGTDYTYYFSVCVE